MSIDALRDAAQQAAETSRLAQIKLSTETTRGAILADPAWSAIHPLCGGSFRVEIDSTSLRSDLDDHGGLGATERRVRVTLGEVELRSSDLTSSIGPEHYDGFACYIQYRMVSAQSRRWSFVFQDGSNVDSTAFHPDALRTIRDAWAVEWDLVTVASFIKNTLCEIPIGADQVEALYGEP